jgi:two-component system, cell cycle sensor histidine kinase and response regulator CckA
MKQALKVLIVEDSEDDTLLIVRKLRKGGYDVSFERVTVQKDFTASLGKGGWDVILCDYTLPNFSGMKALYLLREKDDDTPFIFVSGTLGENTAAQAMKAGANDYITKRDLKQLAPAVERELQAAAERREKKKGGNGQAQE